MRRPFPPGSAAPALPLSLSGEEGFQGPLDALLALLDGEPDRILQVPLAELTEQYTAWLDGAQERGLAEQVEFVETAVYLIRLKTEVLLAEWGFPASATAVPESSAGQEAEDPREELRRRLEERKEELLGWRQRLGELAEQLGRRSLGGAASLPRGPLGETEEKEQAHATDLLVRIREARRQYARAAPIVEIKLEGWSQADAGQWLRERLEGNEVLEFGGLVEAREELRDRYLLFSALLQGCKAGAWTVGQEEPFGSIQIIQRVGLVDPVGRR